MKLANMFPSFFQYVRNALMCHAEHPSKPKHSEFSRFVESADLLHGFFRKFRAPVGFDTSFVAIESTFRDAVSYVVSVAPNKQMVRIAADRIVAFMTKKHSSRNCSSSHYPSHSMRSLHLAVNHHLSIAVTCGSFPRPAFGRIANLDSRPEPISFTDFLLHAGIMKTCLNQVN